MGKFRATYEVADGYAGQAAPQYFSISSDEIDDDMSDDDIREIFYDLMQNHFECFISPEATEEHIDDFVRWAKEQIANRET